MGLKVVNGSIVKGVNGSGNASLEKHRVNVVMSPGQGVIQFMTHMFMVKRMPKVDGALLTPFAGPTFALWNNICHSYPDQTAGMSFVGVLMAQPDGEYKGAVDWVVSVDGAKLTAPEGQQRTDGAPVPPPQPYQRIKVPLHLDEDSGFINRIFRDPQLNTELVATQGGKDMIACILRAVVRVANDEA